MKVGRVAVRADLRKTGIGTRLMQHVAQMAAARGAREIVLHAQTSVIGFYRRLGYREESEAFEEAGIPHLSMRRALP
jgi:predicted GNAT family N-acyltransferase